MFVALWMALIAPACGGENDAAPAPMLDPADAADGCVLVGAEVACNHGHSIGFRSENLRERRLYLESKGITVADHSLLFATDRDGSLGTGMPDPLPTLLRAR